MNSTKHSKETEAKREVRQSRFNPHWAINAEINWEKTLVELMIRQHRCALLYITIEGLHERTEHLDTFLFSAHHSIVFYFRCSVYWWKGVSDFSVLKYY